MYLLLSFMILSVPMEITSSDLSAQHPMYDAVDPDEYILGPGDILWFSMDGGLPSAMAGEIQGGTLYITVTPDGYAVIPAAGAYYVSGLALSEGTALIEDGFSDIFRGMRCEIGLASLRTFMVSVTGQVVSPGMITIHGAQRLTEVLETAGGISSAGRWTAVQIIHSDGNITETDITKFILNGEINNNPTLSLGDRIHVLQAEEFIEVEGAVLWSSGLATSGNIQSSRGTLEYIHGETVSELINRVGGTLPWAERENCRIVRLTADAGEILIQAPLDDLETDPVIMAGDQIVVPGIPPTVAVSGFVFNPGVYPHTAGMSVVHYVSLAGGYEREASVSGMRIILPGGSEKKQNEIEVIPAGSVITVPRTWLVGWEEPLLIITSIATIIIAGIGLSQ